MALCQRQKQKFALSVRLFLTNYFCLKFRVTCKRILFLSSVLPQSILSGEQKDTVYQRHFKKKKKDTLKTN